MEDKPKREPSTKMSILVFTAAIMMILTGVIVLQFDMHIVLLITLGFVCLVSVPLGYHLDDLIECMKKPLVFSYIQ